MTTKQWREYVTGKPGFTYRLASLVSGNTFLLIAIGFCVGFVLVAAALQGIG